MTYDSRGIVRHGGQQASGTLTATAADVERIRICLAGLDGHADSITLWVPGEAFPAWAYAIGANVMHTMRGKGDGFAWCTSDASNLRPRVAVHTYDPFAPWVEFPPHGAEDTKRFKLSIELERG